MNTNLSIETHNAASRLVCMTVSKIYESGQETIIEKGYEILALLNSSQQNGNISILAYVMSLVFLLKITGIQKSFIESGTVRKILGFMALCNDDLQVCYNCLVILWILSYRPAIIPIIEDRKNEAIESIKKVLQMYRREKVVRISCMFFKNVIGNEKCLEILIDCDIYKEVTNLLNRQWQDKEIVQNLELIEKTLNDNYKVLSSFEKLKKQVQDRVLRWGPMHTDMFWAENFKMAEENDFDIIKQLVVLLNDESIQTQAIACYDLGQFARYYPFGRNVLEKLNGKNIILSKMQSPDPKLKENALIAIQKIMISDWQKVSGKENK